MNREEIIKAAKEKLPITPDTTFSGMLQDGFIAGAEYALSQSPSSSDRLKEEHKEMLEMLKQAHVYLRDKERLALITKIESNV